MRVSGFGVEGFHSAQFAVVAEGAEDGADGVVAVAAAGEEAGEAAIDDVRFEAVFVE